MIDVRAADGSALVDPTYGLTLRGTTVTQANLRLNAQGRGTFAVDIPRTLTILQSEVIVTVRAGALSGIAGLPITLNNFNAPVVEFFTETGHLVQGVSNRIYFQVWASAEKTQALDFSQGTIKTRAVVNRVPVDTVLVSGVSTQHQGKGFFDWTPVMTPAPFLEFTIGGTVFNRPLAFPNVPTTSEVVVRVLNNNKLFRANDNLELQFQTNALISGPEAYVVRIQARDLVIYQEQIILNPRSIRNHTILARNFPLSNGGVIILSLQRLTRDLFNYAANPPT